MQQSRQLPPSTKRPWVAALLIVWAGIIFGTSCTVILPHDFFQWLARHVLPNETALRGFVIFWGASWFAIVKGWHATEFAILFWLIFSAGNAFWPARPYRNVGWSVVLSILFAISDEYHQTYVPERGGTVMDVCFDSLGVLTATWFQIRRLGKRCVSTKD